MHNKFVMSSNVNMNILLTQNKRIHKFWSWSASSISDMTFYHHRRLEMSML